MGFYRKSALDVISFHIVHESNDLALPNASKSFSPEMAHQIFGETEQIFGYRHLTIDLYYLHNSAKCFVVMESEGKIPESEICKADDVMQALNSWLPENYTTDRAAFEKALSEEKHDVVYGNIINSFERKGGSYKITVCNINDDNFKEFHQRFETFIIWFIDGANYIDLTDDRWEIFYVYEEHKEEQTGELCYSPIGFCTVYKFFLYPTFTRPRISQLFVLPTHQRRGIGTTFYTTVFNYMRELPETQDITVEEPTEIFQNIRDYSDGLYIYQHLKNNGITINNNNQKQINELLQKYKIGRKQAKRVFDILEYLSTVEKGNIALNTFKENIRSRLASEIEKHTRGSKRLCNMERVGVTLETIDKKALVEAELQKYLESLEWPVEKLKKSVT